MNRRLLNCLTIVSLLLCVTLCILWTRSYRHYDALGFWPDPAQSRVYGVLSDCGTFYAASLRERAGSARAHWSHFVAPPGRSPLATTPGGFAYRRDSADFIVGAPYWLPCAALTLLALAPAWRARSKRRRRSAKGLCPTCGYDLRATPGRCPECGTPAPMTIGG